MKMCLIFLWLRSRIFLLFHRAKVQGMRQSQEGNTKKILLSVKLDKNRSIIRKQTTKINLERCRKMKEEFQQPKGKEERCHILQKEKIKARHKWCLVLTKDEERCKLLLRSRKRKNTVLLNCQRKYKIKVWWFLPIGTWQLPFWKLLGFVTESGNKINTVCLRHHVKRDYTQGHEDGISKEKETIAN